LRDFSGSTIIEPPENNIESSQLKKFNREFKKKRFRRRRSKFLTEKAKNNVLNIKALNLRGFKIENRTSYFGLDQRKGLI